MSKIESLLTEGLTRGYGGKGEKPSKVQRGPFTIKSSQMDIDGGTYLDQWIAGEETGGGQEIVRKEEESATRLYLGGIIPSEKLAKLGLTDEEILGYLKEKIVELGGKTRLFEDCDPAADGKWKYTYKVIHKFPEISFAFGAETIHYDETFVFGHGHMNGPIK